MVMEPDLGQFGPVRPWEADPLPPAIVAENKDKAKETHLALLDGLGPSDLVGYSDGSLIDGRAGAGWALRAVFRSEELWQEKSAALGGQHTVYRGELEGLRMLLSKMRTLTPSSTQPFTLHLCLDNQAAALHPSSPRPTSGQPAHLEIRRLARELKETHPMMTVIVSWVPGHAEVEGNERADAQAKVGAEVVEGEGGVGEGRQQGRKLRRHSMVMPRGGSVEPSDDEHDEWYGGERETSLQAKSNQPPRPHLPALVNPPDGLEDLRSEPKSIAAVQQAFHQAQQAARAASWATAPAGAGLRSVTGKVAPGASFARYHATLSRRQSTLLARLRLDFAGLAAHLHRIQRHPTGLCECGEEETRAHFLLACPLYAAPCAALVRATGKDAMLPLATLLLLLLAKPHPPTSRQLRHFSVFFFHSSFFRLVIPSSTSLYTFPPTSTPT
ncbi:hypothetical protein JCM3775_007321 [Rhodotorula graminis]